MKLFLVCSPDEAISRSYGYIVEAETEGEARTTYLRQVYAKDRVFRDSVLERGINVSFVERFYLQSPQETYRFDETGHASISDEVLAQRVRTFFASRPEFGEAFLAYLDDGNVLRITDEIFEFIAITENAGGIDVFDVATMPRLDPRE